MLKKLICAASIAAFAGLAIAGPEESVTFTGVDSYDGIDAPGNAVLSNAFTGGYNVVSTRIQGTLTSITSGTYASEARLEITTPDGRIYTTPALTATTSYSTEVIDVTLTFPDCDIAAAGNWSFQFYESYNDASGAADSRWDDITITLISPEVGSAPTATDLGTIGAPGATITDSLAVGAINWYKFTITGPAELGSSTYFDIDTNGSILSPSSFPSDDDTEIGLYNAAGDFIATDDDSGDEFMSQLTFGTGSGMAPVGDGEPYDGFFGDLPAGTYYLAVGQYNSAFGCAFDAQSIGIGSGTVTINFFTNIPGGGGGCPADLTGDTFVDDSDFVIFAACYEQFVSEPGCTGSDFNADGFVDDTDFVTFAAAYEAFVCP